jgi:hypothetical protein
MGILLTYRKRIAASRFLRSLVSVLGANVVAVLLPIDRFVHARIQGPWFYRYELLFVAFLLASFLWVDKISAAIALPKWWVLMIFGAVAGWLSGFLALVCSPVLVGESIRLVHAIRLPGGLSGLLVLPFVLMSWFVGALAGLGWMLIATDATFGSRSKSAQ